MLFEGGRGEVQPILQLLCGGGGGCSDRSVCPTLCDPVDCSPTGSSIHRISQARILQWVAMPSSRGSSRPRDGTHVSCKSPALQAGS